MSREQFLIHLISFANKPYLWGGSGPEGYDCSGLVQAVLEKINLDPKGDQTADMLLKHFTLHGVTVFNLGSQPDLGDLVFFGTPKRCTHVGICLNATQMFEAGGGDKNTISVEIAKKKNAMVRVAPINRRVDMITIIRPHGLPWSSHGSGGPSTKAPNLS